IQADSVTAYLLIETGEDSFLHFIYEDALGARFANLLKLDINENESVTDQLVTYLYENGRSINADREVAWRTQVGFSFVDDTPGSYKRQVCLHVSAERTNNPIPTTLGGLSFTSLDTMLKNFQESPSYVDNVAELGIAHLLNERDVVR